MDEISLRTAITRVSREKEFENRLSANFVGKS